MTKSFRSGSVDKKIKATDLPNIEHLCVLAGEEYFVAPRGMSRKQRRKWAKDNLNSK